MRVVEDCMFSHGGGIFSKRRQGLNEEQFKMQLLLKMNQGEKKLVYCTDLEK